MKICTKCKTEKKLSEFGNQKSSKDGFKARCKTCINVDNAKYKKINKNKIKKMNANWYKNNTEHSKEYNRNKYAINPEKVKKTNNNWRINNPDKYAIYKATNSAKRRARKLNLTPNLTNKEKQKIKDIYKESQELTKSTGIQHDVHHKVPLKDGGLHHPDNLEVLTKEEHLRVHKNGKV